VRAVRWLFALLLTAQVALGDDATAIARRHFENGIKLYQDRHFAGALAEFEAAYAQKPGPSSLKNIALSQKALFRYAEAADTLKKVLERHGGELGADERRAVEQAIEELASLVGSIVLQVAPEPSRIAIDGRAVEPGPIHLNVGEYTVTAEAPGYARHTRTIRVAGGQKNVPIEIRLQPLAGFVTIVAKHPDDAIAIDGQARAFRRWSGPLPPGEHIVQVYREGHKNFDKRIAVVVGKQSELQVPELEPLPPGAVPGPVPGDESQARGWYGLAVVSFLGLRDAPQDLDLENSDISGSSVGVRAGYRLWTPIAVEALLEVGSHEVKGAVDKSGAERDFKLESIRLGPNLRILSGGERLRFTSTLGAGAVRHKYELTAPEGQSAKGWDPYFLLEIGAQMNFRHVLAELNLTSFIDGASNVKGDDGFEPYADTGGVVMFGLGLRGGWSEWAPR
jgi:hypothetical protein